MWYNALKIKIQTGVLIMSLDQKIVALRKENKWSQKDVAKKVNIDNKNVSRWETGRSIPSTDAVMKLAEIFGVTTDYLLFDNVPRNGKVTINDVELLKQFQEIATLEEEDREAIKRLIEAMLFKSKVGSLSNRKKE
jgi:transcriptional regulator with XRE-family HTH domain